MILHGLDALAAFFAKTQILDLRNSCNASHQDKNQAHLNIHASKVNVLILL
jgi:hypothetical protein